jgi:rhamnosyltransferase
MTEPRASVVIRARDEAARIGVALDAVASQSLAHEVIVVDSGSADATPALARAAGARVVEMPASRFSFGRALNAGAAEAAGEVVIALSADAVPPDGEWLARVVAHFADPSVACVYGERVDEAFRPLTAPVRQDAARLGAYPFWGYSNSAGAFRASLWAERPFREDMPGTEDREWSQWALDRGHVCVLDPALVVEHDHSKDSLRASYERYEREWAGYRMFLELEPYGARSALREWWVDQGGHRSRTRSRLDPRRMARIAGKWSGRRAG